MLDVMGDDDAERA